MHKTIWIHFFDEGSRLRKRSFSSRRDVLLCSWIFRPGSNLSGPAIKQSSDEGHVHDHLCLVFPIISSGSVIKGFGFSSVQMCSPQCAGLCFCVIDHQVSSLLKPVLLNACFSENRMMLWNEFYSADCRGSFFRLSSLYFMKLNLYFN